MPNVFDPKHKPTDYLLIPSMPTPNGRLHLGHLAGPFLKLDVIARYLRTRGDRAFFMSGTDSYESHVLLQAEREGRSPVEVANHYFGAIQEDMAALSIACDVFVNPLDPQWRDLYDRHSRGILRRLVEVGAARYTKRSFPYSAEPGKFIPASYTVGECPSCGAQTAGHVCEACGHMFRQDTMKNPRLRNGQPIPAWRELDSLSMSVSDREGLLRRLEDVSLPPRFRRIVETHIARFGAGMELTVPSEWGVRWTEAPGPTPQTFFTYCTAYPSSLALGELFGLATGTCKNAFDVGAPVTTVISYGVDVTIPVVFVMMAFTWESRETRAFDYFLGNEFFSLEGSKFSTSRGHAIWGADMINKTPVTADAARYYLAVVSPDESETDFNVDEFVQVVNERVVTRMAEAAASGLASLPPGEPDAPSEAFINLFQRYVDEQRASFDLSGFALARVPPLLDRWTEIEMARALAGKSENYWHLKAFSLLASPLMPNFARELWSRLGGSGEPSLAEFLTCSKPVPGELRTAQRRLARGDLVPCLPRSLAGVMEIPTEARVAVQQGA